MEIANFDQYMTTQEISAQWGVDARTVQNLCRKGEIEQAIKRAGSWFIPKDAPSPLKNNKSNSKEFDFTGTKKRVFDGAIELFSNVGFENVTMRDIGYVVKITQATIYHHFSSKQEILDKIYDYYAENFNNNQKPVKEMKELLKNGTKDQFCSALMFTFEEIGQNAEKYKRMTLITKIIYMRLYQDERARDLFLIQMNSEVESYVQEILEYGVSIGVLEKFDIPTYTKFLVGQRHIMGIKAFANPNYELKQLEEEKRIMQMSADMLPFISKK